MADTHPMEATVPYGLPCEVRQRRAEDYSEIKLRTPPLPQSASRLLGGHLPGELLNEITGHLEVDDLATLCLTCKIAYKSWFTPDLQLHLSTGCYHVENLLKRLSRDLHRASGPAHARLFEYCLHHRRLCPCTCRRCRGWWQGAEVVIYALLYGLAQTLPFFNDGGSNNNKNENGPTPYPVYYRHDLGVCFRQCWVYSPPSLPPPSTEDLDPVRPWLRPFASFALLLFIVVALCLCFLLFLFTFVPVVLLIAVIVKLLEALMHPFRKL
ncbi:hypothetical protein PG994_014877 [Apiospora phragmitis]|uniref:F-box domain-containing protein n=1 Tax=Apiospora phragmitis TaxID=2905665 RepID=A0ABR1SUV5_9PEZI